MNYSTAIALFNADVRAILCEYDPQDTRNRVLFKTLDKTIKKDDLVVIPTGTRVGFTVVKVVEVDLDFDHDDGKIVAWIVTKIDRAAYEEILIQETKAVEIMKSAQKRRKTEELRAAIIKDQDAQMQTLKALPIVTINGTDEAKE